MDFIFVAIEGPIGVGKSALIDSLEKEYGKPNLSTFREELEPNPFLDKFYTDKAKYAFQTQVSFMLSRYQQYELLQKKLSQRNIFDKQKKIISNFIFEKNDIFAELTIEGEEEWELYQKIRHALTESLKNMIKPNFVIYLRAGEETLFKNIQNRLKQTEILKLKNKDNYNDKHITKEYLCKLTELYDKYFFNYKASPVLIIDVNNTDFVHEARFNSMIVNSVKNAIDNPITQNTYIKFEDKKEQNS